MKFIKYFFALDFFLCGFIGIPQYLKTSQISNLFASIFCFVIAFLLFRSASKKKLNKTLPDQASYSLEQKREGNSLNDSLSKQTSPLSGEDNIRKTIQTSIENLPLANSELENSYIDDGNMIFRTDGKEISEEEVPYLIQIGYEKIIKNQTNFKTDLPPDLNEQERCFFNELELALSDIKRNITAKRMSNNVISVYSNSFYVGKIKLSGRKHWMQILRGKTQIKVIDGELDDFIQRIPDWIRYVRIHCK